MYDVIIIGAGPVGLSLAIAAQKRGLDYLVLEKGVLVNSIYGYPRNMNFFSTASEIEIGDIPFTSTSTKPTRQEALQYYRRVADHFRLRIKYQATVTRIKSVDDVFQVILADKEKLSSKKVVLATGYFDNPNVLGIAGEKLAKVSHYYKESHPYFHKKVLIIGGRNSAIEAALEIYRSGGEVTLVHRRSGFDNKVKYWVKPDIENRIARGEITAYFDSEVLEIKPHSVRIEVENEKVVEIENDFVLALTGFTPDTNLMKSAGVIVDEETIIPQHNRDTFETNISGLYIAGTLAAGREANRIFIENGRAHGEVIMTDIQRSLA